MTRKGQVTIPKEIRDALKLKEGDRVLFVQRDEQVILKVLRGNTLDLKGFVEPSRRPEDFDRVRRSVKKAISTRLGGHG